MVGYAAIKYAAIVIIVLAVLAFLAWYVVPKFH
jgi:type II secretory pathway component PulF